MAEKILGENLAIEDLVKMVNEGVRNGMGDAWAEERAKRLEEMKQRGPDYTRQPTASALGTSYAPANAQKFDDRAMFGRMVQYLARAGNNHFVAQDMAHRAGDEKVAAAMGGKAMGEDLMSTGGAMVAPTFAEEIIESLQPASVFLEAGPQIVPMPNGNYSQSYADSGPTSYFQGESQNVNDSTITTGLLQMSAKTQLTIVPVSNQLLQDGGARSQMAVQREIERAMGARRDVGCFNDDGTQNKPLGIRRIITGASNSKDAGSFSVAQATQDLIDCMGYPEDDNVIEDKPTWFMAPRTRRKLMASLTSNGLPVWPELSAGQLYGYPVKVCSNSDAIPIADGSGSDESYIYFVNMGHVLYGQASSLELAVVPYAAYYNATAAAVVSGLSRLETVVLAVERWDVAMSRRGYEGGLLTAVKWGS